MSKINFQKTLLAKLRTLFEPILNLDGTDEDIAIKVLPKKLKVIVP